jgi:micrococcal nuclease
MYEYQATIIRIVDGDTFDADVDLGFHTISRQRFRIRGYSAPEMSGLEREMGSKAKEKLAEVLPLHSVIRLASAKTEKFGRWLADVTLEGGGALALYLIKEGYGLPWDGSGKRPVFDVKGAYPMRGAVLAS